MYGYMEYYAGWTVALACSVQLILSIFGIALLICYKRKYPIEQTSRNPLSIVYKVLKYSYVHRYPERRSAFTYWEIDAPSRFDFGKPYDLWVSRNMEVHSLMNRWKMLKLCLG